MKYIARGTIAPHGANERLVGQFTWLSESEQGWYQWDGWHKATAFATAQAALDCATECTGPLFRMPAPESIVAVETDDEQLVARNSAWG